MNSAKENILNRIRLGKEKANLWNKISEPKHSDFFVKSNADLISIFKDALEKINGQLLIANNKEELSKIIQDLPSSIVCMDSSLQNILNESKVTFSNKIDTKTNPTGFIKCEFIIARLGSVLTSSAINSGRQINIFPEHQVVFAEKHQLVYDIKDGIQGILKKYDKLPSMISFATGPSRTADIEKTLILGAHGPKMLTIILKNFN